jgi:hypothetical protein
MLGFRPASGAVRVAVDKQESQVAENQLKASDYMDKNMGARTKGAYHKKNMQAMQQ